MIGNPTEGLKQYDRPVAGLRQRGRMIGNPTEGLKRRQWLRLRPVRPGAE